ncbi:VOC family protein [Methylobacterium sp. P1-11]|uniref:VOC family protein n=1 Tax=Methylobacterium sp. P1-11 TaxID=2024616 RepID=UPI0015635D83|nr:VOC family protein [Methylobacterium sp. P1-11]
MSDQDFVSFGPVHLEVTDPDRTARFWEVLFGFTQRPGGLGSIEVGTSDETLLVLHGGARAPVQPGFSGLYHVAIHTPDERDFARLLKRFSDLQYPVSPTDHTFSKAIYLADPDGINVEVTLETPERFRGVRPGAGNRLLFIGTDGVERPGAYPLDLEKIFEAYEPGSEKEPAPRGRKVGHIHLHVGDLERARDFYAGLGLELERWWPPMQVADFGAGGPFKHRIAINTWQGRGAPPAPAGSARMRHFEMRFETPGHLRAALAANPSAVGDGDTYRLVDPSGNEFRLRQALTRGGTD